MKKLSLKKVLVRYKMYFGDYVFYVSVDFETKVFTLFFGDKSIFDKLIADVIKSRGRFRDVTDDFTVNAVYGPSSTMVPLGYFKDLPCLFDKD